MSGTEDTDDNTSVSSEASDEKPKNKKNQKLKVKKGPGRPRNKPKKEPMPRNGISPTPSTENALVELVYDSPLLIKKLIAFFKLLATEHIQIIFRPTEIIIYAQEHNNKSKIYVKIDSKKLNHYYCKQIMDIGIASKDIESILNTVDKDYNSIIIVSNIASQNKNITIILENEMYTDETYIIDLIGQYDHLENEHKFIDEDYTIQFEWTGKYFRKKINDIKTFASQFCISQKNISSDIEIGYTSLNKKIQSRHLIKDSSKIKLKSKLKNDDSFRVDLKVDYIKPIASAHIADNILILADENKLFMTKSYIDNMTIEIKTLTEIIDLRKQIK
jgi:hypothetical protein